MILPKFYFYVGFYGIVDIRKLSSHGLTEAHEQKLWDCVRAKFPTPSSPVSNSSTPSILYFLASDSSDTINRVPPDLHPHLYCLTS